MTTNVLVRKVAWVILVVAVVGCATSKRERRLEAALAEGTAPPVPGFMNGPMSLVLKEAGEFAANVVWVPPAGTNGPQVVGLLVGSGGKLRFLPDTKGGSSKHNPLPGVSFLWDVRVGSGYVLCEMLQGYAPVTSDIHYTNLQAQPHPSQPEASRVDGHACAQETARVSASDGSVHELQVFRAADLNGFPMRITAGGDASGSVLSLTKASVTAPARELLTVPDGFTQYKNPDAMVVELNLRQLSGRRKAPDAPPDHEHEMRPEDHRMRGVY
jgi:hypothetical protein